MLTLFLQLEHPEIALHDGDRDVVDRQMARPIRQQVNWADVRARTADSPYAAAFFTLVEGLGVVESPRSG